MKRKTILIVLAALVIASSGVVQAQDNVLTTYSKRCASCHGGDGAGKTPAAARMKIPDLRSPAIQSRSDTQLFDAIGRGANHTTYPHVFLQTGMTEMQVRMMVGYLRTFAKK